MGAGAPAPQPSRPRLEHLGGCTWRSHGRPPGAGVQLNYMRSPLDAFDALVVTVSFAFAVFLAITTDDGAAQAGTLVTLGRLVRIFRLMTVMNKIQKSRARCAPTPRLERSPQTSSSGAVPRPLAGTTSAAAAAAAALGSPRRAACLTRRATWSGQRARAAQEAKVQEAGIARGEGA